MAAPLHIPTNSAQNFQFLHILADTCYFVNDHLQQCDVVPHLVLICICSVILSIFSSFVMLSTFSSSLENCLFKSFAYCENFYVVQL